MSAWGKAWRKAVVDDDDARDGRDRAGLARPAHGTPPRRPRHRRRQADLEDHYLQPRRPRQRAGPYEVKFAPAIIAQLERRWQPPASPGDRRPDAGHELIPHHSPALAGLVGAQRPGLVPHHVEEDGCRLGSTTTLELEPAVASAADDHAALVGQVEPTAGDRAPRSRAPRRPVRAVTSARLDVGGVDLVGRPGSRWPSWLQRRPGAPGRRRG